jgi:hypothetical protein
MPTFQLPIRAVALAAASLVLASCGPPDTQALQRLACQQAGANLDMQSLTQMDALRKALGLAPDVDPIAACRAVGVELSPAPASPQPADQPESGSNPEE